MPGKGARNGDLSVPHEQRRFSPRMNVQETWEVEHWTGKWGCTEAELKAAVQAVGTMAEKVEAYLRHHRHKRE